MAWYRDVVIINFQPNVNLTIHDGTLRFSRTLSDEHIAGILLMAKNIFGPQYLDHIQLEFMLTPYWAFNYYTDQVDYVNLSGRRLIRTDNLENNYLITTSSQYIEYQSEIQYWHDYIRQLAAFSLSIPHEITKPYTCRFKNKRDSDNRISIYQFTRSDFIEGAISLCQWFHLNYHDYLDQIHLDESPQPINITTN